MKEPLFVSAAVSRFFLLRDEGEFELQAAEKEFDRLVGEFFKKLIALRQARRPADISETKELRRIFDELVRAQSRWGTIESKISRKA